MRDLRGKRPGHVIVWLEGWELARTRNTLVTHKGDRELKAWLA